MHGVDQSEAVTAAAKKLSEAQEALRAAYATYAAMPDDGSSEPTLAAYKQDVENAHAAYKAAYMVYTNPFKVVKTFS